MSDVEPRLLGNHDISLERSINRGKYLLNRVSRSLTKAMSVYDSEQPPPVRNIFAQTLDDYDFFDAERNYRRNKILSAKLPAKSHLGIPVVNNDNAVVTIGSGTIGLGLERAQLSFETLKKNHMDDWDVRERLFWTQQIANDTKQVTRLKKIAKRRSFAESRRLVVENAKGERSMTKKEYEAYKEQCAEQLAKRQREIKEVKEQREEHLRARAKHREEQLSALFLNDEREREVFVSGAQLVHHSFDPEYSKKYLPPSPPPAQELRRESSALLLFQRLPSQSQKFASHSAVTASPGQGAKKMPSPIRSPSAPLVSVSACRARCSTEQVVAAKHSLAGEMRTVGKKCDELRKADSVQRTSSLNLEHNRLKQQWQQQKKEAKDNFIIQRQKMHKQAVAEKAIWKQCTTERLEALKRPKVMWSPSPRL